MHTASPFKYFKLYSKWTDTIKEEEVAGNRHQDDRALVGRAQLHRVGCLVLKQPLQIERCGGFCFFNCFPIQKKTRVCLCWLRFVRVRLYPAAHATRV